MIWCQSVNHISGILQMTFQTCENAEMHFSLDDHLAERQAARGALNGYQGSLSGTRLPACSNATSMPIAVI